MTLKKFAAAAVLAVATTGALAGTATPALAGDHPRPRHHHTHGDFGLLSGNQIIAPISIPISLCGNAIAIFGIAGAGCDGGASTR